MGNELRERGSLDGKRLLGAAAVNGVLVPDQRRSPRNGERFADRTIQGTSGQPVSPVRENIRRIHAATVRMLGMVDDLLRMTRINLAPMNRCRVDLDVIAGRVLDDLRATHAECDVRLTVEKGLHVIGDPDLLRILLECLFDNAWKFRSDSRPVEIRLGRAKDQSADGEVFQVSDNGIGFDQSREDEIWKPYHRLHPQGEFAGHGVGLALASLVVERHGGRIWAEGRPGRGAAFFFTLG